MKGELYKQVSKEKNGMDEKVEKENWVERRIS